MTYPRWIQAVLLSAALALGAPLAQAADAQDFMKAKQTELSALVKNTKTAADDKKLYAAFDEVLDYDVLARESLKDYWDERKPEERVEFQETLKKLVRAAYKKSLKRIANYDVEYQGESKAELGQMVRTVAKSRTNNREEAISLDYVVHEVSGKWRVVDVVTEGSSLLGNYRSQFRRIIKKQGFPELLRRMRTKLEKGEVD
jgi:phospholipid transport system substrate-binding protein